MMALSEETGVKILEDCAQVHGGKYRGRYLGTIGHAAGFSMNESKQMSTGDGGFVMTDNEETARIAGLFHDKTYIRDGSIGYGDQPIPFAALNYRPSCLQAAVGLAQLHKLPDLVARRDAQARRYYEALGDLPHLHLPTIVEGGEPSWWPIPARYTGSDPETTAIREALSAEGLRIGNRMGPAGNILRTDLIGQKRYYPLTDEVPAFWRDTEYDPESCPNVDTHQANVMRLPIDQRYSDEDIEETIAGIRKVWAHYFGTSP
jgi:dTDP-4-amino-4,6-dideoxygalactose transaminase